MKWNLDWDEIDGVRASDNAGGVVGNASKATQNEGKNEWGFGKFWEEEGNVRAWEKNEG